MTLRPARGLHTAASAFSLEFLATVSATRIVGNDGPKSMSADADSGGSAVRIGGVMAMLRSLRKRVAIADVARLMACAVMLWCSACDRDGASSQPNPTAQNPTTAADHGPTPAAGALNVLLITLDTTRADILGCYGGRPEISPNIDAIAAQGAVFEHAYSQSNVTNPSHLSIMSGRCAIDHGVFGLVETLPDSTPVISEAFQDAGYRTAAFISVRHLADLGWRGFSNRGKLVPPTRRGREAVAEDVTDQAVAWLGTVPRKRPVFMWAHYFDPHLSYDPPQEIADRFFPPLDERAAATQPVTQYLTPPPSRDFSHGFSNGHWRKFQALYAGEVFYTDRELGRLFDAFKTAGRFDNTLIIITADHGESLGEHGIFCDHEGLYEPQVHIPLIVRMPGSKPGVRLAPLVNHLDIAPTLAGLCGLERDAGWEGLDLSPALNGEVPEVLKARDTLIIESAHNRNVVVRKGDWKLFIPVERQLKRIRAHIPNQVELYNLRNDPGELNNLADVRKDIVAELRPYTRRWRKHGLHVVKPRDDEQRSRLEALGYFGSDDELEDDESDR